MKVKDIRQLLESLKDEDEIYCITYDTDELHFELETEETLIDMANNQAGAEDFREEEWINDVNNAIEYLVEFDNDIHIME